MAGTLLVSRAVLLHSDHKKKLEDLGFSNVTVTAVDKDGLNMLINQLKPDILIIGSRFYKSATPYMTALLRRKFKDLNIAAVSINEYPADLAVKFVVNGINSYVNYLDGIDQFYRGLKEMSKGKNFVSPSVRERMETCGELPPPALELTEREIEVLRLLCNGFTSMEIANELYISKRTVEFHKAALFNRLGTRNENELIRVALYLGIIKVDELDFYGGDFALLPKQKAGANNKYKRGEKYVNQNEKRGIQAGRYFRTV
jgi:DNA-binding NarL/FixJ family response regulator